VYDCTTRCVRRAFLLEAGKSIRKEWLENWIKELAEIFAVGVDRFSESQKGNAAHFCLIRWEDVSVNTLPPKPGHVMEPWHPPAILTSLRRASYGYGPDLFSWENRLCNACPFRFYPDAP
jgi:hypothetical protein